MHHAALDRAGAHDRDLDHQVVEIRGLQPRQHGHLRARFDLEHAHGVGVLDHGVDRGVFRGHVAHRKRCAPLLADQGQRALDRREHAQREHVHFEQAERIEIVLVPLDHAALDHGGIFDRHQARQQAARDDEAADMLRQVARKADQRICQSEQAQDGRAGGIEAGFAQALREVLAPVPPGERLCQPLDLGEFQAERLAAVADRALRPVADHRGGKRRALAPVLGVNVLDHFLAPLVLEIDVDVGRLVALARNKTLEQHAHARRIDFGDAERIAHRRIRGGTTALAKNVPLAREADDVVHGEKVRLVAEFGDQFEFVLDQGWTLCGTPAGKRRARPAAVSARRWPEGVAPGGTISSGYS